MSEAAGLTGTLAPLDADLRAIFGGRLRAFLAYGPRVLEAMQAAGAGDASRGHGSVEFHPDAPVHTLALVDRVRFEDLAACAARAAGWRARGFATPLILGVVEFERSLDAFPLEYGEILAHHVLVSGDSPFQTVKVKPDDVRRACEVQAKSHLLHLREAYVESRGTADGVAQVIVASAPPLAALLRHIARLQGEPAVRAEDIAAHADRTIGVPGDVLRRVITLVRPEDLLPPEVTRLFPAYLDAVERIATYVDQWKA
jgi:hypothetical protein